MRRHVLPVVALLVALLMARQLYPYASGTEPTVVDGYEVKRVAANLGGPTCLVWANDTHLLICDRDGGASRNWTSKPMSDGRFLAGWIGLTDWWCSTIQPSCRRPAS